MNPNNQDNEADDKRMDADNPLAVLQPGERHICEIKRHPIDLIGVYLTTGLVITVAIAVAVLVPYLMPDLDQQLKLGVVLGALLVVVITLLYGYIGSYVYKGNRWIVTSDSITEITQIGLFSKQTSQLSLANMEDVTVDQDGLLQQMFGYGALRVETAGEHSKFTFPFCPNPNQYAKEIIAAHEAYIADKPEETITANRPLTAADTYNQPK